MKAWDGLFIQYRPFLVSFAFRIMGSLSEAEDLVQETFLECARFAPSEINNHKAWLTKVCSNKSLDHLKSAYKKRELYPGNWLPDQVPERLQVWHHLANEDLPENKVMQSEGLTTSFLLMAERLTPEERVVYLLKEAFGYPYKEIGEFLGKNEAACRKTAQRAREALDSGKKFGDPPRGAEKLIAEFFALAKQGDAKKLAQMLASGSKLWGDGGGKVAAAGFIQGADRIARYFIMLAGLPEFNSDGYKVEFHRVNSRPGMVISRQLPSGLWAFDTVTSFEFENDKITRIYGQRNPEKLDALRLGFRSWITSLSVPLGFSP
ncbi:MAG TPA: sigma-70 family RNA polymerase sigma factor [Fibrobacteria bacterium]|nr:sigma-70 family RNA polymerase sigma factor [Fibrobacteria bacterium]